MAESLYVDLHIVNNDVNLDSGGEPLTLDNRDSIAQDIKHLIRETGLMVQIIGQRDDIKVQILLQQLTLEIEEDDRLIPGTVVITRTDTELFYITADTVEFGPIDIYVTL